MPKTVGAKFFTNPPVEPAVFSPDGKRIAATGTDRAARVRDAATGLPVD